MLADRAVRPGKGGGTSVKRILWAAAILALVSASPVRGQSRQGAWTGVGLGVGSLQIGNPNSRTALGGHVELGGAISQTFLFGAKANTWWDQQDRAWNLHMVGYLYPSPSSRFFFEGGLGWSHVQFKKGQIVYGFPGALVGFGLDTPIWGDNLFLHHLSSSILRYRASRLPK